MIQIILNFGTSAELPRKKTRNSPRRRAKRKERDKTSGLVQGEFQFDKDWEAERNVRPGDGRSRLSRIVRTIAARTGLEHRSIWTELYTSAARSGGIRDFMVEGHRRRSKTHLEVASDGEVEALVDMAISMLEKTNQTSQ